MSAATDACARLRAERDRAREIAVRLEQENEALVRLIETLGSA